MENLNCLCLFFNCSYPSGNLGALQTDKQFLGKGYASLVTRAIIKQIAELGHDVLAGMVKDNTASMSLFRKLGFEYVDTIDWISTKLYWNETDE